MGKLWALRAAIGFPEGQSRAMVMRLAMLMTQYRAPIDWNARRLEEATSIYKKWKRVAKKPEDISKISVPDEVMNALLNDMNTPVAVMAMTSLANQGRGEELYVAMSLLGFIEGRIAP